MLKEGHLLPYFQRQYGFRRLNFAGITGHLIRKFRFDDCLEMFKTMRLTQQTFSSVMCKLCSYAQHEPEMFKFIVSRVIKPFALFVAPCKIDYVPADVSKRSATQEIQARTYMDMLTRYFNTPHTVFTGCRASDHAWLSARYMAFDARTPETFLALPPSMRRSIRLSLWVTRSMPRDLRNRVARVLVMQMFTANTALDLTSAVGDTRNNNNVSTRDEIRLLFIQSRYGEILEKLTGVGEMFWGDVSALWQFCKCMGSSTAGHLKLLELHRLLGDESCLPIASVTSWQQGLNDLTVEQQDYIASFLKSRAVQATEPQLLASPSEFQRRLLYHGYTVLGFQPTLGYQESNAVTEWLNAWKTWKPVSGHNRFMYSAAFNKECQTLLLCLKKFGVTSMEIQHNIARQLAYLHGISYTLRMRHGALAHVTTKLRYVETAKKSRVICLDPIMSRAELYNTSLPEMHPITYEEAQSVKRVRRGCKKACLNCLLTKWTLADLHNALVRWRDFSTLLREKNSNQF
jgi:hypothetical protein